MECRSGTLRLHREEQWQLQTLERPRSRESTPCAVSWQPFPPMGPHRHTAVQVIPDINRNMEEPADKANHAEPPSAPDYAIIIEIRSKGFVSSNLVKRYDGGTPAPTHTGSKARVRDCTQKYDCKTPFAMSNTTMASDSAMGAIPIRKEAFHTHIENS